MKHIACVYTAGALVTALKEKIQTEIPDARITTIVDETLISDIISAGSITPALEHRFMQLIDAAAATQADVVFNTCSSVGELADKAQQAHDIPIIKIDEFMMRSAVTECSSLAVIATLPSTLDPTMRLLQKCADSAGRSVSLHQGLAKGAFDAVVSGDTETHDRLILETALQLQNNVDGIVLAQGSMARFADALASQTGKTIYASVNTGVQGLKSFLNKK